MLFIHDVIAGVLLGFTGGDVDLLTLFELGNNAVDLGVLVGGLFAGSRDNERSTRFVNQDGIDLIDDGEIVSALHAIVQIELHVVAQIVETEFVVSAVGNVGGVGLATLLVVKIVYDDAHTEAQEAIEFAHPLGIALGQIVIDCDYVHAAPAQGI